MMGVKGAAVGLVLALQQAWGFGVPVPAMIRCPAPVLGAAAHPQSESRLRGRVVMKAGKTTSKQRKGARVATQLMSTVTWLTRAPSAEESWNVGRFARTFGFFNGNPLLKLIPFAPSGAPSVAQPPPRAVSSAELALWQFEGLNKVAFENMWAPLDDVVMGGVSVRCEADAECHCRDDRGQGGREAGRQGGREAGRQGGREVGRQAGVQTQTHRHIGKRGPVLRAGA